MIIITVIVVVVFIVVIVVNIKIGMQVGRMGSVSACGRNVSCSQPSLHLQGAPLVRGAV